MILLSKLYEKTIIIAKTQEDNSNIRSKIITRQSIKINQQQDTIAVIAKDNLILSEENKDLKQKIKLKNRNILMGAVILVIETFKIIKDNVYP